MDPSELARQFWSRHDGETDDDALHRLAEHASLGRCALQVGVGTRRSQLRSESRAEPDVGLQETVYLVHFAALNSERLVVVPDGLGVGRVEQAVHLPIVIVEQLDLCHAEFVALPIFCILSELIDRNSWQLQLGMKIHESRQSDLQGR